MTDLHSLLQPVLDHATLRKALASLSQLGSEPIAVSGLTPAAKALVVATLAHQLDRPVVVLTKDNEAAQAYRQTTATFLEWLKPQSGSSVQVLPAMDCSPYESRSPHAEIQEQRAVALWNLARGGVKVIYTSVAAVMARFRGGGFYASLALDLKVGDELSLEDLVEHLRSVGYEPGEPVTGVGEYSIRGGIVDVFPPEVEWPYRLEFFADQLESVREFDPTSQRSRKPVSHALLLPLSEAQRSPDFFERLVKELIQRARHHAQKRGTPLPAHEPEWAAEHTNTFPGWEFFVPVIEPHAHTLFSLLDRPVLIWDEILDRKLDIPKVVEGSASGYEEVRDTVPPPPEPRELFLDEAEFMQATEGLPQIALKELTVGSLAPALEVSTQAVAIGGDLYFPPEGENFAKELEESKESASVPSADRASGVVAPDDDIPPSEFPALPPAALAAEAAISWPDAPILSQPSPKYQGGVKAMIEDLRARIKRGESVIFVVPTTGKMDRLREILKDYEVPFNSLSDEKKKPEATTPLADTSGAFIARGEIFEGVAFPDLRQLWLADADLFGGFDWAGRGRRERSGISSFISDLGDLKVGDYVVHIDHGIGIYQGLRQIAVAGATRDFMLLTFQDEAKLYVPLERLDLVEKYRSQEGAKPRSTGWAEPPGSEPRLASREHCAIWPRSSCSSTRTAKMRGGNAISPDTPWQHEFEDAFAFEETPDQLSAIAEIKRDLENPEPMDRLLCGDVGYGKTEIAMRAAFKVVQDGRQVAVLTPTTVLSFQHYNTFRQRMAAFPVRVEMLSRFRTAAEQKKVVAEAEAGSVDILIGTHRLLSKDVHFRDLGLLIVDEEQRFGVAAKEKLKKFKASVDVLTMSATPIPRTLHMSLGGLRDLSVIETPPRGRLAIQTTVAPFRLSR